MHGVVVSCARSLRAMSTAATIGQPATHAPRIDGTAFVHPSASLADGVVVGRHCWVGAGVTLGRGVTLRPSCVVDGRTTLGAGTQVHSFAVIGGPPQDRKHAARDDGGAHSVLEVGADCVLREHVTVNAGTRLGGGRTRLGDGVLLMAGAHVGHDCDIGAGAVLANYACAAGHVEIGAGAIVGGLAGLRQHVCVGELAMVGGHCAVDGSVVPFGLVGRVAGHSGGVASEGAAAATAEDPGCSGTAVPACGGGGGGGAKLLGLNLVGLRRAGASALHVRELRAALQYVFGAAHAGPAGAGAGPGATPASADFVRRLPRHLTLASRVRELARAVEEDGCAAGGKGGANERLQTLLRFLVRNEGRHRSTLCRAELTNG
eukprot:g3494.t1